VHTRGRRSPLAMRLTTYALGAIHIRMVEVVGTNEFEAWYLERVG